MDNTAGRARRAVLVSALLAGAVAAQAQGGSMLSYLGRSSVRIATPSGIVIYVDPYAGTDYALPADLILVTHGHGDHNRIDKPARKPGCVVVAAPDAVSAGPEVRFMKRGETIVEKGVTIRAVAAGNRNHDPSESLGFVISFDGISLYHAGDTSKLAEMADLASLGLSYALLPVDGFYNMGAKEAMDCAALIKAKRWLPIHSSPKGDFDAANARAFTLPGTFVLAPGESLALEP